MKGKPLVRLELGRLKRRWDDVRDYRRARAVAKAADNFVASGGKDHGDPSHKRRNYFVFALEILFVSIVAYFWM